MSRFRYVLDPLCLAACAAYGINRWIVPAAWKGTFLHGQFDDMLLIPAALPVLLWVQRRLGMRPDDRPPTWSEILLHLVAWSMAAEWLAPRVFAWTTGDVRDVGAYAVGALVAGVVWSWQARRRPAAA